MLIQQELDDDTDRRRSTARGLVIAFLSVLFWMTTVLLPESRSITLGCDGSSVWTVQRSFFTIVLSDIYNGVMWDMLGLFVETFSKGAAAGLELIKRCFAFLRNLQSIGTIVRFYIPLFYFQVLYYNSMSSTQKEDFRRFRHPITFVLFLIRSRASAGLLLPFMKFAAQSQLETDYLSFQQQLCSQLRFLKQSPATFVNQTVKFTIPELLKATFQIGLEFDKNEQLHLQLGNALATLSGLSQTSIFCTLTS
jgi:hypothetical protein